MKDERVAAEEVYAAAGLGAPAAVAGVDKKQLVDDVRAALYASKAGKVQTNNNHPGLTKRKHPPGFFFKSSQP